jgi:hypothetical protein
MFAPAFHIVKQRFTKNYQPYKILPICQIRDHLQSQNFEIHNVDHGFFLPIVAHRIIRSQRFTRSSEKFFSSMGITKHFGSPVTIFARRKK